MVTAVLLLLCAAGIYGYVRLTLIDRIDDTIDHVAEVWQRLPSPAPVQASALDDDRIDLEWFDARGERLWSTFKSAEVLPLRPTPPYRTVTLPSGETLRQLTTAVADGYLRISHPWFEVTKPTADLFLDLSLAVLLLVLVVGLCGWWLSGLAMVPVENAYQRLRQFTADASHELRNPIAVIQTNVQAALAAPAPDWETQAQQLEVIERLARRLGRLVDDLLFLARYDSRAIAPRKGLWALGPLVTDVVEEQQTLAQAKNLQLWVESPFPEVSLHGDREQLSRLLTNLLGNAIAYTPSGSVIVRGQVIPNRQVQLTIQDTGMGIPATALPQVFERFYRHRPLPTGGSGLGLAIAKAIIEGHHGQIRLDSQPQVGTTVTVTLPLGG
jgi:OmpR-family two-component system manganese-sensing sensor histidine kinase